MLEISTFKRGLEKGFKTTWELTKVMTPVYVGVSILGQTPILRWLSVLAKPIMGLMGLPGEAATALVLGNVLNIYAAIGAIVALHLNTREVTVLALVLLISHNLFVETSVSKKSGLKVAPLVAIRIFGGVLAGIMLNWLWRWF